MAAPSIPNLATLGRGSRLRGGRGRNATHVATQKSAEDEAKHKDAVVQRTDNDAASSRASTVALGYLEDPYASSFAQFPPPRRYPLINRGTYVRTTAIDRLVMSFLDALLDQPKQILSLGAGSDTRFFRFSSNTGLGYHEIDFATITSQKITTIMQHERLMRTLRTIPDVPSEHTVSEDRTCLYSRRLNIHALDLRQLAHAPAHHQTLPGLAKDVPTLIVSECCLTYLPADTANTIIKHITSTWLAPTTPTGIVLYEPIKPHDAFGKTMTSNLASRDIDMPSLRALPTLQTHRQRLQGLDFGHAGARSVYDIYMGGRNSDPDTMTPTREGDIGRGDVGRAGRPSSEQWITPEERERVEKLEWLDEVEEWQLLAGHYCVVWGWRDGSAAAAEEEETTVRARHGPGGGDDVDDDDDDPFPRAWGGIAGHYQESEREDEEVQLAGTRHTRTLS